MACCSLILLLLSQPLMLLGAMKARLLNAGGIRGFAGACFSSKQGRLGLASLLAVEVVLALAMAPYVLARSMPAETQAWGSSVWQICSIENKRFAFGATKAKVAGAAL